jgi:hypothetical protein
MLAQNPTAARSGFKFTKIPHPSLENFWRREFFVWNKHLAEEI